MYAWKATIPVFKERLNEARKQRAESFQDKAIDLAIDNVGIDSKEVASVRLAVDTLKWAAEKNDPDRFGKKEEGAGKSGGNSVKIVLNTGVLDTVMPSNIVVDETGNFLGFEETDNGNEMSVAEQLAKDRPECHWFVCTTTTAYKADTPTVSKYEISERGVLPA